MNTKYKNPHKNLKTMLNVAVIGCGYWGPNLIRNFSQIDLTNLYCVCDIKEDKLIPIKKTYPSVKITTDYKHILKDPKVDAVAVAVPIAFHYQLTKDALLNNKQQNYPELPSLHQ